MTTVSALIPVYNGVQYIRNAVQSVLNQRGVEVEVIVIDDGSTDETCAVLQEFGTAIKVLRQSNMGPVWARNHGAKLARGQWLAFLDADDEWLPDKLTKQLACAEAGIGLVYTDRQNFGEIDRVQEVQSQTVRLWEGDLFEPLLLENFVTASSVIMRRDWFERLGGFDITVPVCEDWDLWLRFAAVGGQAAVCREPLTRYRWHATSMTFDHPRMCAGRLQVVQRGLASTRGRQLPRVVKRQALAAAWKTSAWYAMDTQRWRAMQWFGRAALCWPWDMAVYKGLVKCGLGLV